MSVVAAVATATPGALRQTELRGAAAAVLGDEHPILSVFDNARITTRHLAMPLDWYVAPHGFRDRNEAYTKVGFELCVEAATKALRAAGVAPAEVGATIFVSTTGMATPSMEARLSNRLGFSPGMVRVPVWGLGCAGGVAGLARAAELADRLQAPVLLVALELCSLSFDIERALDPGSRRPDKKSLVAASLFSDGCAAAVLRPAGPGPTVVAAQSHLFPDTERVMGWDVEDNHLEVVLSPDIPDLVEREMAKVAAPLLARHGRPDEWILHPGGARVIDAYGEAFGLVHEELRHARDVLDSHGNMSSPTVLFALEAALRDGSLTGRTALLGALGPGFSCELLVLRGT
ncbi:MAG: type III polyketide synthase [Thermoplasmatota archaeon]